MEKVVNKTEKVSNDSLQEWKKIVIIQSVRILSRSKEKKEQFYSLFRNIIFTTIGNWRALELIVDK